MKSRVTSGSVSVLPVEVLAIPLFEGMLDDREVFWAFREFDRLNEGVLSARRELKPEFKGKKGQTFTAHTRIAGGVHTVLVVGMGKLADFKPADARLLTHALAKEARECGAKKVGVTPPLMPEHEADVLQHLAEGLVLGSYTPDIHQKDRKPFTVEELVVALSDEVAELDDDEAEEMLRRGELIANAVNTARDLVNLGPNEVTPKDLAKFALSLAEKHKGVLTAEILAKGECKKLGMHLLLAVAAGSSEDPRFIHLVYRPKKNKKHTKKVAIIGKGITFDSGGLGIKTGEQMVGMKCDMAGAAAVLSAMQVIAMLKPSVEIHVLVAAAENMTGDQAYRPGDIYTAMDGTTVEVGHTDAEGRMTLADAIAYARQVVGADLILELSTLTGAARIALGLQTAGFTTTDDGLAAQFAEAAKGVGEDVWRLPLTDEAKGLNKSTVADIRNIGSMAGIAGALTAAQFLQHFAGGKPFVHCDIAGPAYTDEPWGVHPKGGTGFGLMTLVWFIMAMSNRS